MKFFDKLARRFVALFAPRVTLDELTGNLPRSAGSRIASTNASNPSNADEST